MLMMKVSKWIRQEAGWAHSPFQTPVPTEKHWKRKCFKGKCLSYGCRHFAVKNDTHIRNTRTHTCTHADTHTHTQPRARTHTQPRARTHTHARAHARTQSHTHTQCRKLGRGGGGGGKKNKWSQKKGQMWDPISLPKWQRIAYDLLQPPTCSSFSPHPSLSLSLPAHASYSFSFLFLSSFF